MRTEDIEEANKALLEKRAQAEAKIAVPNAMEGLVGIELVKRQVDCVDCPNQFEAEGMEWQGRFIGPDRCQDCFRAHNAQLEQERGEKSAKAKQARRESWLKFCPGTYQKTDVARLKREGKLVSVVEGSPSTSAELVEKVLARPYGPRGLALVGTARVGKTRLMLKLLERYHIEENHRVIYTYAPDFSDELAAAYSKSAADANNFIKRLFTVPCWFLDDLGKGILTDRALSAILRIVEHRTNNELPIFITGNKDGDELKHRLTNEHTGEVSEWAEPLIERIREFCDGECF